MSIVLGWFILSLVLQATHAEIESIEADIDHGRLSLDRVIEDLQLKLNPVGYYHDKLTSNLKDGIFKLAPKVFIMYLEENSLEYSPEELKLRYKLFEDAFRKVLFNKESSWKKGINKFSDKSSQERVEYLGYNRSRTLSNEVRGTSEPEIEDVGMIVGNQGELGWPLYPQSGTVDWRERGAITTPLDQGHCGICWAFASTSVIESLYYIKTGVLRSMSVQQVADCTYSTSGCVGGWYGDVYSYLLHSNKFATSSAYPLNIPDKVNKLTINRGCLHKKLASSPDAIKVAYLSQYVSSKSEERIVEALSKQPLTAGIHAPDSLFNYKSGVFVERNCPSSPETNNHAVVLAGYSPTIFIVKNSWGERWGEGGYFRLNRKGWNCGVITDVVWPTLYTYRERDPDSSFTPCQDTQPWCRVYAVMACPFSTHYREICPYSCSLCSCRDLTETCSEKLDQCSSILAVQWECRRSCKLCHCPPGTSLCRTRCLPYWDNNLKPRYCNNQLSNNSQFED